MTIAVIYVIVSSLHCIIILNLNIATGQKKEGKTVDQCPYIFYASDKVAGLLTQVPESWPT